jgi:RNA polymerase-binding transcription factor
MPYGNITMPRAAKETKTTKATKAKKTTAPAKTAKPAKAAKKKAPTKVAKASKPAKAATKSKPTATKSKAAVTKSKTAATKPKAAASKSKAAVTKPKAAATKPKKATRSAKKAGGEQFNNFDPYKTKRGEKYMNEVQRAHFKAILVNWKSELMQEVDRTVSHMKDEAANFPDPADRATQEEEFSLELRTRDRERKLIKKIDSTMELIDQNDYGYCEACGIEIGIQRLEARPTATQCIDCKTLAEIKEKQEMG